MMLIQKYAGFIYHYGAKLREGRSGETCATKSSSKNQTCEVVWKTNSVQMIKERTDPRSHSCKPLRLFFFLLNDSSKSQMVAADPSLQ